MPPSLSEAGRARRRNRRRHQRQVMTIIGFTAVGIASSAVVVTSSPSEVPSATRRGTSAETAVTRAVPTGLTTIVTRDPAPLADRTVLIDPGHNGANVEHPVEIGRLVDIGTQERACDTPGTRTDDGYTEAEYNLDVAMRVADVLRNQGATVVMTRDRNDGWGPCIDERAAIGNRAGADVAVSIHADGGPATGRGFHVIYPPPIPGLTDDIAAGSRALALIVREELDVLTGMPRADYIASDALSERSDLGGLNLSDVPKVLVETGNMRNPMDALLLRDSAFRVRVSEAVATSILKFLVV